MPENKEIKIVLEGSKVTVKIKEKIKIFTIVHPSKVNTVIGYISYESPLGKALINSKVGEFTSYKNPIGEIIFAEILQIE